MKARLFVITYSTLLALAGCDREGSATGGGPAVSPAGDPPPSVTNRISVPEAVRQNLGITFAKVERRRVASTVRLPGRFELLPSARREYRAAGAGRVELLVKQYERVQPGTPLYRLQSPEWAKLRQQLQDDQSAARRAAAEVKAAEAAKVEAEKLVGILRERVAAFGEAGTRRIELELQLAEKQASLPRLDADINAKRAEAEAASQRLPLTLSTAASLLGLPVEELTKEVKPTGGGDPTPKWRTIDEIEVRAAAAGQVETFGVTNGSWAEQAQLVLATADPQAVRFRASALQSDMGAFADGSVATIVAPADRKVGRESIPGQVAIGLEASADTRTVELVITPQRPAPWARPGVTAIAEIVTDETAAPELAIPLAAVVQDELARIYFRRDPRDPDKVMRVEGDFGVSDGRWVAVMSGLKEGDEVVLEGVYELKLTGGGKPAGGGHFHADGTWHAEPDK
jgi:hypothetical protein